MKDIDNITVRRILNPMTCMIQSRTGIDCFSLAIIIKWTTIIMWFVTIIFFEQLVVWANLSNLPKGSGVLSEISNNSILSRIFASIAIIYNFSKIEEVKKLQGGTILCRDLKFELSWEDKHNMIWVILSIMAILVTAYAKGSYSLYTFVISVLFLSPFALAQLSNLLSICTPNIANSSNLVEC